jgi:hypothetical protein
MSNHGGVELTGTVTLVPIYDTSAGAAAGDPGSWAGIVATAGSAEAQLVSGYTGGTRVNVTAPLGLPLGLSGSVDLGSTPGVQALDDAQSAGKIPPGSIAVVMVPAGVSMTLGGAGLCGGHSLMTASTYVDYALQGSDLCPHGSGFYISHELAETLSDPWMSAWYGPGQEEIGDLCFPTGFSYGGLFLSAIYANWADGGAGGCIGL